MKKIILILLAILNMSCQAQQKNDMNQDKVNFYPKDLVHLKSIPTSYDVLAVTFKKSIGSSKTMLSKVLLRQVLSHENTRILNPNNKLDTELLDGYSYSPWYTIDFNTVKGNYTITLFLGGLGFMTLPNGKRGAVLFDLSDLKKEEEIKLLIYFKQIKRKALSTLTGDEDDVKEIKLYLGAKVITYNIDGDAIQINNISPHPSKEFSENQGIHQYTIKEGNSKVSFWKRDTQILETGNYYPKMVADFINTVERLTTQQGAYNSTMKLMKDNVLVFPDGLKIDLAYFSHKRVYENQRSPAIAHLELSDNHSEEKWFTIRRSEDKDEHGKFITSYESGKWKNYNIELTDLSYDGYIDIIVTKLNEYNTTIVLPEGETILFPDGLKIEFAGFTPRRVFNRKKVTLFSRLKISKNQGVEYANISVGKTVKKDKQDKLITTYSSAEWKNYNIELKNLSDGESIDIIVTKKSDKNLVKNFIDITNELSKDEFEKIKNYILKNKGKQTYRNYDNNNPHFAFIDFDIYLGADIGQKNLNNDPEISNFNELTIKHTILGAPIKYYQIVIVRKGDVHKGKTHVLEGMEEDKVYLVDLDSVGLDKLKKQILPFLKTIKEKVTSSK